MKYIEDIAKVCHEANRAYCETLGDFSQVTWEHAPKWQRESAIDGVQKKIANPDMTPEMQHEAWMDRKKAEGWKYGPVKSENVKEHPCMVPYCELPGEQRVKDYLFGAIVSALTVRLEGREMKEE